MLTTVGTLKHSPIALLDVSEAPLSQYGVKSLGAGWRVGHKTNAPSVSYTTHRGEQRNNVISSVASAWAPQLPLDLRRRM